MTKCLVRVIGTEDYLEQYAPIATTKDKATRFTRAEAQGYVDRNKMRNKGKAGVEIVEVEE